MKLTEIYHRYPVPESLQRHMLCVAAVVQFIVHHWKGPGIDGQSAIAAALVHDLGNLVKFDLSEGATVIDPTLHTPEWRQTQQDTVQRYHRHAHQATLAMLRELKVSDAIREIADGMDIADICEIAENGLELQICEYADLRVTPYGIVSLEQRMADLRERYRGKYRQWGDDSSFAQTAECARKIEAALQGYTSVDITEIPVQTAESYLVELAETEIPTETA